MAIINKGQFSKLLMPGVRKYYVDEFESWKEQYTKVFNILSTDKPYETDVTMAGLPTAVQKDEGTSYTLVQPIQGNSKVYTPVSYGLGFVVTREMWDDDQSNKIKKMTGQLARSMRWVAETAAANVYNRAWNSSYLGADGKVLAATDHPLLRGSTFANTPASAGALSVTTLKAALNYFKKSVGHEGAPIIMTPKILLIPPDLEFTANEILKTNGMPYSADNTINPVEGALQIVVNNFLTSTTAWFVLASKHDMNFFWRTRPAGAPEGSDDPFTGNAMYTNFQRFICSWTEPFGVYGNAGA